MKIPKHLPFIILSVGAAHALFITTIVPRGETGESSAADSSATLPHKTTGFIDEPTGERVPADTGPQRNPLNLMITEEEEVQVPVNDAQENSEDTKIAAALLFPVSGTAKAETQTSIGTTTVVNEEESGFAEKELDHFAEPEPVIEPASVLVVSAARAETQARKQEVIPPPPVEIVSVSSALLAEKVPQPNKNEEEPPASAEPVFKQEEKITTTADDIAEELLSNATIDDPALELDLSDSAVAAAMIKIERARKNATSLPITPAAEKKIRVKVLTPTPLEGKPLKISPPPIPPSS